MKSPEEADKEPPFGVGAQESSSEGGPLAVPGIDEVRRFWDANPLHDGVSEHPPGTREFFEHHRRVTFHEHSGDPDRIFLKDVGPGVDALDVGCGIGFWVHLLADDGASVVGLDLSRTAVELTERRLRLYGVDGIALQGNAEQLPFGDASFDHVNCQGVIHHTPRTEACLREFRRVLKKGGTVCFSVYLRTWLLRSRLLFRAMRSAAGSVFEMRGRGRETLFDAETPEEFVRMYDGRENPLGKAYTRAEVREMIDGLFDVLEVRRFGVPREALPFDLPDAVHRWLSRRFGLMIVYRCRKVS